MKRLQVSDALVTKRKKNEDYVESKKNILYHYFSATDTNISEPNNDKNISLLNMDEKECVKREKESQTTGIRYSVKNDLSSDDKSISKRCSLAFKDDKSNVRIDSGKEISFVIKKSKNSQKNVKEKVDQTNKNKCISDMNVCEKNCLNYSAPNQEILMKPITKKTVNREVENNSNLDISYQVSSAVCKNKKSPKTKHIVCVKNSSDIDTKKSDCTLNISPIKKESISIENKKISAEHFKDIIYSFHYDDFCKPYRKLHNKLTPDCCEPASCKKKHESMNPKEINSFFNGSFFNILDNPLTNWLYDVSTAAFSVLRPEQYFRGDVMRILFYYILHGTSKDLMWDIKHILSMHFEVHPPCTEKMRMYYLHLLDQGYDGDCYFKTELADIGVLNYIINQLEEYFHITEPQCATEEDLSSISLNQEDTNVISFQTMECRWERCEPLLDIEHKKVMDTLDNMAEIPKEENKIMLNNCEILTRLIVALELIVDLLEADFLICVSKLKRYISDEQFNSEIQLPLIKHFTDNVLGMKVFKLYTHTTNNALWIQLSRLIGLMAEQVHLFNSTCVKAWKYPELHPDCSVFINTLSKTINERDWSENELLLRLQMLSPPWLQLELAMSWANTKLKVKMGADLKSLVDIIHMHVTSPVKLEKVPKKTKPYHGLMENHSEKFIKRAAKKNQYGETLLHRLCKQKQSSMAELNSLLAIEDTDINAKDNYGWTPLHEAVGAQSILKTTILLQYLPPPGRMGLDISAQNCKGSTALHEAVISKNIELCKLLVTYGGPCLLNKMDSEGLTPLELAKGDLMINQYFQQVLKTQELLNLSAESLLNLPDYLIQLLIIACNVFTSEYHTWQVYCVMKFDKKCKKVLSEENIVINQDLLLKFKYDQHQFRKLRKILNKLAENPKNSALVRLWDRKFKSVINCT